MSCTAPTPIYDLLVVEVADPAQLLRDLKTVIDEETITPEPVFPATDPDTDEVIP